MENVFRKEGASTEIKQCGFNLTLNDINEWLVEKKILINKNKLLYYEDLDEWAPSGGETYLTRFKIFYTNNNRIITKTIVIKAIVSLNAEVQLETWRRRRSILHRFKAPVSYWYNCSKGIIIEDYYPCDYQATKDFNKLIYIAKILDELGFVALDYLNDIRCNNNGHPYYIDFGFDLGEPTYCKKNISINKLIEHYPHKEEDILNKLLTIRE